MNKNTLQAITEVLAAIDTLKEEVMRLESEVRMAQKEEESNLDFIREYIVDRAYHDVYFNESDCIILETDHGRNEVSITAELDTEEVKRTMSNVISDSFYYLKEELEQRRRDKSVTDED